MNLEIIKGNLFASKCQTLVNTVNCVGVMGAGIALEFRLRYPAMYTRYVELCKQKQMEIGKLWLYKSDRRWVLNFPTKNHWKKPSDAKFLKLGLQKFVDTYKEKGITSIAFPLLGTQNGGIPTDESLAIMQKYLSHCDIPVEIYYFDPDAPDDLFTDLKTEFLRLSESELIEVTGLSKAYIKRVREVIEGDRTYSLAAFLATEGIGVKTVEKTLCLLTGLKQKNEVK